MNHEFAEEYAHLEEWHWWFRGRQRILESVLRRELRGQAAAAIASLGCGPPGGLSWLTRLAERNGCVVGIDSDPTHARYPVAHVRCIVGRMEAIPLASGRFDAVLALDVLEHLDDDVAGLREAGRLLKPGGLLLVTVPALPSLWGGQDVISHHRRRYTRSMLLDLFRCAGLRPPRVTYFNTLLFPPVASLRWARRALGTAAEPRSDFDGIHPGLVNNLLESIFAAERYIISRVTLPVGVSLLATTRLT